MLFGYSLVQATLVPFFAHLCSPARTPRTPLLLSAADDDDDGAGLLDSRCAAAYDDFVGSEACLCCVPLSVSGTARERGEPGVGEVDRSDLHSREDGGDLAGYLVSGHPDSILLNRTTTTLPQNHRMRRN